MLMYICGWQAAAVMSSKILFSNIVNLSGNHHATRDAVGLLSIDPGLFSGCFLLTRGFFSVLRSRNFFVFNNIVDFPRLGATKGKTPTTCRRVTFFLLTQWFFLVLWQKEWYYIVSRGVPCLWQRHGTQWWATNFVACNLFLSLSIFPTTMQLGQNSWVASGVGLQYGYFL